MDTGFMPRAMLRTEAAAMYLGLSRASLEKMRVVGNGPTFAKLGRIVLYDPIDLDSWISEHKVKSTSEYAPV